jgi:hypothetical protein
MRKEQNSHIHVRGITGASFLLVVLIEGRSPDANHSLTIFCVAKNSLEKTNRIYYTKPERTAVAIAFLEE